MENQMLERSSLNINLELNEKRRLQVLEKLLKFKYYTRKSEVASTIINILMEKIDYMMKLNDNRYLLWAFVYVGLQRIIDRTQSNYEKGICSMLINQISELLEVNDVFHISVQSFYNLINTNEEENEFNFLLSVLHNIEANNIYVQHIDILVVDNELVEKEKVRKPQGEPEVETKWKKDYIKVLKPLLSCMFVQFSKFDDESGDSYSKHLTNKLTEAKLKADEYMKKNETKSSKKPIERGLK